MCCPAKWRKGRQPVSIEAGSQQAEAAAQRSAERMSSPEEASLTKQRPFPIGCVDGFRGDLEEGLDLGATPDPRHPHPLPSCPCSRALSSSSDGVLSAMAHASSISEPYRRAGLLLGLCEEAAWVLAVARLQSERGIHCLCWSHPCRY